ncbi:MAG: Ig-like domain-containing protein [Lachnospiraceae bacterium]|nr:Ig-like domain-containing protein [Lachnospiraceae bacterium]
MKCAKCNSELPIISENNLKFCPSCNASIESMLNEVLAESDDVCNSQKFRESSISSPFIKWGVTIIAFIIIISVTILHSALRTISVSNIFIKNDEVTIGLGDGIALYDNVEPHNASNSNVTWVSSDESVVVVSDGGGRNGGWVTGISAGTATIKAFTENGHFTAECTVVVLPNKIAVRGVSFLEDDIKIGLGEESYINLIVKEIIDPLNASNKTVTWRSSDENIVAINEDYITGISLGTATITVSTEDGNHSTSCRVTVLPTNDISVSGLNVDKELTLGLNDRGFIRMEIEPSNASNKKVIWKSNDENIVAINFASDFLIDGCFVTGVSAGLATLTATTEDGDYIASCNVTVLPKSIPVSSVSIIIPDLDVLFNAYRVGITLEVGDDKLISAIILPLNATNKKVKWKSSNESIAVVNNDGLVIGISVGTATITITTEDGDYHRQCIVNVVPSTSQLR